jgi:lipoate-protein ligase A
MKEWRFSIDSKPLSGSWNMAVDDFLFRSLGDTPQTILRFYAWERPTVSLGYSQKAHKVVDTDFCKKSGVDIVRRMTGGKLVLHHREVTYSLCSSDAETFTPTLRDSYRLISEGLMRGLEKMGLTPSLAQDPPLSYKKGDLPCFAFPAQNEIEVGGKKIVGSAQRREGTRFIQHGSIPLADDEGLLVSVSLQREEVPELRMTSLSQALGRDVDFSWAAEHLASGMSEYFNVHLIQMPLTTEEKESILKIQSERYAHPYRTFR